ncbi:hypothetical protein HC928_00480 [bacterium]|nr:hypothetical protein [bacterium]
MKDDDEPLLYVTIPVPNYHPLKRGKQADPEHTLTGTLRVRIHPHDEKFLRRWCRQNGIGLSFFIREVVSATAERIKAAERSDE